MPERALEEKGLHHDRLDCYTDKKCAYEAYQKVQGFAQYQSNNGLMPPGFCTLASFQGICRLTDFAIPPP